MNRCRGFRIKQYSYPCCSGCLTDPFRIITSGDGSGINLLAEDIGEYFDAPCPFVGQFLLAAV
jgi:hypothetical protein